MGKGIIVIFYSFLGGNPILFYCIILMKDGVSKNGALGELHAARGMELHVLNPGSTFRILGNNKLQMELGQ
jgi:hypothetical protein